MVDQQIISLYEDEGLEIQQIAEQLELDPLCVKTALANGSSIYRNNAKRGFESIITDEEYGELKGIALQLARSAEDQRVQASMIRFLLEQRQIDKRGVADAPKIQINVLQQMIGASRERLAKALTPNGSES